MAETSSEVGSRDAPLRSSLVDEAPSAGAVAASATLVRDILAANPFMSPPKKRPCCARCAPCCWDIVPWRGSSCNCCSRAFVKNMTLFEHREVEALYLHHAKGGRRAKIIPPLITGLALVPIVMTIYLGVAYDVLFSLVFAAPALLCAVAGLSICCAAFCRPRVKYQLRVVAFWFAIATATMAYIGACLAVAQLLNPFIAFLGILWVCQKALVIADVVAARALVVVVPVNALVLLVGIALAVLFFIGNIIDVKVVVRSVFDLALSVVASSGVLLWIALRNESASRTVFYWNHVVGSNVNTLDAEANPFAAKRLQSWMSSRDLSSSDSGAQCIELTSYGNVPHSTRQGTAFWELDGSSLKLDDKIAAGGGGVVWRATLDGNVVAAKQVYTAMSRDVSQVTELASEVEVLAQLSHDNIVRFLGLCHHDLDEKPGSTLPPLFIVQEYCATNLRSFLIEDLPSMHREHWRAEVHRVAAEIASAMAYLHSRKVLHRDLKPENVFLTDTHTVRVGDFGISAQFLEASASSAASPAAEHIGGTPAYMSPEAMSPALAAPGPQSDVYAYGVILCELLHTDKHFDILSLLITNGKFNRTLLAAMSSKDNAVAQEWKGPPACDLQDADVQLLAQLSEQCCAFDCMRRPSFSDISSELSTEVDLPACSTSQLRPHSWSTASIASTLIRMPSAGLENQGKGSGKSTPVSRPPNLSVADIRTEIDVQPDPHRQVGVGKCSHNWWIRRKLRFPDDNVERRFLAFLHSEHFFRYLRWPYVVLAALYSSFAITMFSLSDALHAVYPLSVAVIFVVAALMSWVSKLQPYSMITLTSLALLSGTIQWGTAMADNFATDDFCNCFGGNCSFECEVEFAIAFLPEYVLQLFQGLTMPVTLLVLGLPFYLYAWVLGLFAVSWLTSAVAAALALLDFGEPEQLLAFVPMVVAGLALFPICAASAVMSELARRTMYSNLSKLRTQESNLLDRATFRGYRQALLANWEYLASTPSAHGPGSKPHAVTAVTI